MRQPSFIYAHPLEALGAFRGKLTPMPISLNNICTWHSITRRPFQKCIVGGQVPRYSNLNSSLKHKTPGGSSTAEMRNFFSTHQLGRNKLKTALDGQGESEDETAPCSLDMKIVEPDDYSVIEEWRSDWYCYWDDSYGMPSDPETNYVFKPPLEMSRSGVVRILDDDWEEGSYDSAIADSVRTIINLFKEAKEDEFCFIGNGDESDNVWIPIAIRWTYDDGELTPESFLNKIGAHPELINCFHFWKLTEDEDEDDYDDYASFERRHIKPFLSNKDSFLYFYSGCDKLNPVPCFAVAKMCPGLVAGFIGGVVYT